MRTVEEMLAWLEDDDIFGTRTSDLIYYLPYSRARALLTEEAQKKYDAAPETWPIKPLTRENVLESMREYLSFAIEKVLDHRGLSAGRSVEHFRNWVWLLGDAELTSDYSQYGAPVLKEVAMRYKFPWPEDKSLNRMASGEPCIDGCEEGCG